MTRQHPSNDNADTDRAVRTHVCVICGALRTVAPEGGAPCGQCGGYWHFAMHDRNVADDAAGVHSNRFGGFE